MKLTGNNNYKGWSCAMVLALETKNKLGFIDGSVIRSVDNDVLGRQWDRCNSVVLSWILNSIYDDMFVSQVFSRVASEQFDALVKLPSCTCNVAHDFSKHNQLLKLMQVLMGLDDTYFRIRNSILTTNPLPNVKTVFSLVSREESHRGVTRSSDSKTQSTALFGKTNDNKKRAGKSPPICKHCGVTGHTIESCYKLIGFPKDFQFTKSKTGQSFKPSSNNACSTNTSGCGQKTSTTLSEDQINKPLSHLYQKHPENISVNMAGMFPVNMSNFNSNFSHSGWIIDSGANQHMTSSTSHRLKMCLIFLI
ncbi:hypothetical protein L6452_31176 [Arctium lappa]|uniref:Uncharacterized protein n=1 Tax=Arctium lappa TaxID=4217 RepID=A0ACB8ZL71_ARCLA|nr:hypothetical protein L6452_31176 [Arctium lappa]